MLIPVALLLILVLLAFLVWRVLRDAPSRVELTQLRARAAEMPSLLEQLQGKTAEAAQLQVDKARLDTELQHVRSNAEEKLKLLQASEARLKAEFENLANRIFEDRGRVLAEQGRERLAGLLQPFKEQLDAFRRRADDLHRDDAERSARLLEQVRLLQDTSNRVSDEANNLARAIKGESKRQGDWGELVVERIFEAAGLERGRDYDAQAGLRSDDGRLQRPDFIVYLPGEKAVIIDAKVSLTDYERGFGVEDSELRDAALAAHVKSVRRHVDELRSRDYSKLLGNRTLDFVLMCIPLEPAYQEALRADHDLLYDLAGTNVVVTGPVTLMITLKLIAQIWRRENENRNAEIIAERAGRMYDQVALVVEALADARKKMSGVTEAFELAMRRLQTGRGNLVSRVEHLRRLGAKVGKQLPATLVEEAEATPPAGDTPPAALP
ncbi:MAG: DNA recombination protein RmuC [Kiritimatiellia bacterium]